MESKSHRAAEKNRTHSQQGPRVYIKQARKAGDLGLAKTKQKLAVIMFEVVSYFFGKLPNASNLV